MGIIVSWFNNLLITNQYNLTITENIDNKYNNKMYDVQTETEPIKDDVTILKNSMLNKEIEILIVDDSIPILKMTTLLINKMTPYKSIGESGGVDALINIKNKFTQNKQYDLIIIDLVMPDMDGYQLAKEIREMENTCNMKKHIIIGMCAKFPNGRVCINKDFDYELNKPFSVTSLLDIINNSFI